MSMQRLIALVSCLAAFGLEAARGAEINFEATVDRTRVGEADPIQFTLTITADESIDHLPAPKISLKDFGAVGPVIKDRLS